MAQNYLVFQPMCRYFKRISGAGNGDQIYYWQSKRLSDKKNNFIKTPNDRQAQIIMVLKQEQNLMEAV